MSYAASAQYLTRYGLAETAGLLGVGDIETVLSAVIGGGLAPGAGADDIERATLAASRLDVALRMAENIMDGYLRAVVTLPLSAGDANAPTLSECCMALARYALSSGADSMTEQRQKERDQWMGWLRDVSSRRVQLIVSEGQPAPAHGAVRTGQARSAYDWATHGMGTGYAGPQ